MRRISIFALSVVICSNIWAQKPLLTESIKSKDQVNFASEKAKKSFIPRSQTVVKLKSVRKEASSFEVSFVGFPEEAKSAFLYAVSIWDDIISSPEPIKINAKWEPLQTNTLAKSRPASFLKNFEGALTQDVYYPVALAEKLAQKALNQENPDIFCTFNSSIFWYFETDGNTPENNYDLTTAVLHEIGHGLGISGFLETNDQSGFFDNNNNLPSVFDYFVYNGLNQKISDPLIFQSPSENLLEQLTSENLNFQCPDNNLLQENEIALLYAPSTWKDGSSVYHLDEQKYGAGTKNALMTPFTFKGEAIHDPGNITVEILNEMGWQTISFQFQEIKDFEETCANFPVSIEVKNDLPIDSSSVKMIFSTNYFASSDSVLLRFDKTTSKYTGNMPLNFFKGTVMYYIKAQSTEQLEFRYPSFAPKSVLNFRIGPDYYPPQLSHNPNKLISGAKPSLNISALAEDNLGVKSVTVEYKIDGNEQDPFILSTDNSTKFEGELLLPEFLNENSLVEYRLVAEDKSTHCNKKTVPSNEYYQVQVFHPAQPVSGYFSDFDTENNDFINADFTVSTPQGFSNGILHSCHPYPKSNLDDKCYDLIAQLKYPVILEKYGQMSFDEIVLVEPGEPNTDYSDQLFWDFVIIEGSKDNGESWMPLSDGYDAQENSDWQSTFENSVTNNTSNAVGQENMFMKNTINLTSANGFAAGDTVIFRFRLSSDNSVNGWGWAIDNLKIQSVTTDNNTLAINNSVKIYPNPFQNDIYIHILDEAINDQYIFTINDINGRAIYKEMYQSESPQKKRVNVQNLPCGVYIFELKTTEKYIIRRKFIKQ